jgi:glutathione reductase (NADPH)
MVLLKQHAHITAPSIRRLFFSHPIHKRTQGLTEEQAAEKYPRVAVFSKSYTPLREGIAAAGRAAAAAASRGSGAAGGAAAGPLRGLAKVVVDEESDRLLGVHLVGQDAPEAIQVGAL